MLVDYWGALSIDRAIRGHMLCLSLFDYTDDVMAAGDRPIDFSDMTGSMPLLKRGGRVSQ
jgi:hypothetical protein